MHMNGRWSLVEDMVLTTFDDCFCSKACCLHSALLYCIEHFEACSDLTKAYQIIKRQYHLLAAFWEDSIQRVVDAVSGQPCAALSPVQCPFGSGAASFGMLHAPITKPCNAVQADLPIHHLDHSAGDVWSDSF